MTQTLAYPLKIEPHPEEDGFLAYFPDLPGCQTWGDSYEAATRNAQEALNLYLETLLANGDPLPEVSEIETDWRFGIHNLAADRCESWSSNQRTSS